MGGQLIFITGGIRSGKSTLAEQIAADLGSRITYLATAQPLDEEMRQRIDRHRQRRPDDWTTVEEPIRVTEAIIKHGPGCDVIVLDCLTILLSNLLLAESAKPDRSKRPDAQQAIITEVVSLAKAAKEAAAHVIIVSNEVGLTLVSDNPLGRQYQELVGRANQIIAGLADRAYLVVAGHPIELKKDSTGRIDRQGLTGGD